jgi:pimeloyl-ACP methyl ester carboxylesterase
MPRRHRRQLVADLPGPGFRVIGPSRFGYFGSTLPAGATPADQADAYALLLEHVGVDRALVIAFSAGSGSGLEFARRHPERCRLAGAIGQAGAAGVERVRFLAYKLAYLWAAGAMRRFGRLEPEGPPVGCENSDSAPDQRFRGPAIWLRPGPDTCFVNIVWRHLLPCLTSGSQQGSTSWEQPPGSGPVERARGKPPVRATIRIGAPVGIKAVPPGYLSDPDGADLRAMVEGVKLARRIFGTRAFAQDVGDYMEPPPGEWTDVDLASFVREQGETLYHPVGTCRMGEDAHAVVDSRLRVHGTEALRVVDASVMPEFLRGHINAAVIMIGERGAELIRERGSRTVMSRDITWCPRGEPNERAEIWQARLCR